MKNPRDYTLNEIEAIALINRSTLMVDNVQSLLEWLGSLAELEHKIVLVNEVRKIERRQQENIKVPRGRPSEILDEAVGVVIGL